MWCDHISDTKNDTSVSGDMKQHAVRTYWKMVQKETLPGSVIQVAAWVSVKHIFSFVYIFIIPAQLLLG